MRPASQASWRLYWAAPAPPRRPPRPPRRACPHTSPQQTATAGVPSYAGKQIGDDDAAGYGGDDDLHITINAAATGLPNRPGHFRPPRIAKPH